MNPFSRYIVPLFRWLCRRLLLITSYTFAVLLLALGILIVYLGYRMVYSTAFTLSIQAIDSTYGATIQAVMFTVFLFLVALPILWFSVLRGTSIASAQEKARTTGHGSPLRSPKDLIDLIVDLSTAIIPLFILGLALLLELPNAKEGLQPGAIGSIASIMVLYCLTLLAAFVFDKLTKAKREITDEIYQASDWLQLQSRLSRPAVPGISIPGSLVYGMLDEWRAVLEGTTSATQGRPLTTQNTVRHVCLASLLSSYAEEERIDIAGGLLRSRVPKAVWPPAYHRGQEEDQPLAAGRSSFFATNIGFYATYLARLLQDLPKLRSAKGLAPTMAVVTSVLPSYWWNWPFREPDGTIRYGIHLPVVRYRVAQQRFAQSYGQIYRRIVVMDKGSPDLGVAQLADRRIAQELAGKHRFHISEGKLWVASRDQRLSLLEREDDRIVADNTSPRNVVEDLDKDLQTEGSLGVYWAMIEEEDGSYQCPKSTEHSCSCCSSVLDVYQQTFHPRSGMTELAVLPEKAIREDIFPVGAGAPGLGGCLDFMFLGLAPNQEQELWTESGGKNVSWGCAMMASMSPGTETMFLTVVHDEEDVRLLWEAVRGASNRGKLSLIPSQPERGEREAVVQLTGGSRVASPAGAS